MGSFSINPNSYSAIQPQGFKALQSNRKTTQNFLEIYPQTNTQKPPLFQKKTTVLPWALCILGQIWRNDR